MFLALMLSLRRFYRRGGVRQVSPNGGGFPSPFPSGLGVIFSAVPG